MTITSKNKNKVHYNFIKDYIDAIEDIMVFYEKASF